MYRRIRYILLAAALLFVWAVMASQERGEWYAVTVYPWLSGKLAAFSSCFPFSVGDCFIYGSVAGLLLYLAWTLVGRRPLLPALARVGEYLAWVYVWFYIAWGLNYFRADFFMRAGVAYHPYNAERFKAFLVDYTDSLNASWIEPGMVDTSVVAQAVEAGYRRLSPRLSLALPPDGTRPKSPLFSRLMAGVGVTGYMGPFFAEFHLNRLLLPAQYPATYAHEMAHLLGVSNEAEANLCGYLVCVGSSEPAVRFSGYLSLLPYVLSNAYQVLDKESFEAWRQSLRPEIWLLYNEKVAYWHALYSPLIGEIQDVTYNFFLRSHKISSGTQNYSEVISLLIAWEEGNSQSAVV